MKSFVLITGASRGIGKAIAQKLAAEGCNLVLTCKSSYESLLSLKEELEKTYGILCIAKQCDAKDSVAIKELFDEITDINIIINNAGISHVGLLQDMTEDEWNTVMATNLSSAFYTAKYAIPHMLKAHSGRIINISSVWGNTGAATEVAYSASKGGLNAFTKALAKELAPSNISVNAIACGYIDTDMNRHLQPEDIQALNDEIPAGRAGSTEEVAQTVWNVLNMPTYYTGQILTLDGSWT